MIPSDQFVRFYNEVFKKLDQFGGLEAYFLEISRHQEMHCLKEFQEHGLKGVYNYYVNILREENCDLDMDFRDGGLRLMMTRCPSLSKAIDNDAGPSPKYCDHCPGWAMPLYRRAGLFEVYDLMGHENPQCCAWIFDDLELAKKKYAELAAGRQPGEILTSFQNGGSAK